MEFLNIYAFLFLFPVAFLFFIKSKKLPFSKETAEKITIKGKIPKKTKFYLLTAAFVLFITALARPVIINGYVTIKAPVQNLVIALDISRQMDSKDLYPDREKFAKTKIKDLINNLGTQNTALLLFDRNTYLVSPPTKDYGSLTYLLKHTNLKEMKRTPTPDIKNMINTAENLVKNPKIVIFTSELYTPKNKNVFVYLCNSRHINAKNVFNAQYSNSNIIKLSKRLNASKSKKIKIKDKTELFYYPLFLGIMIMFFVIFFPLRRNG
ncbi:VWA domain-containing protein [Nautilia sp.]